MKIVSNVPQGIKILKALKYLNRQRKDIYDARQKEDYKREREHILTATMDWGGNLCKDLGIEIEVTGRENLPKEGPVLYVSNHQSYSDIPIHCAVLDTVQFGFIAKKELEKIPLYGKSIIDIRSVMMDRDNPRESLKAIKEGTELIEKGFSLLIFPEGTRSRCHEMAEFKKGSLRLATKPGVPVVPITLDGAYHVYEETGKISGAKIKYTIHPAIETKGMDRKEAAELAETVEKIIRSAL